MATGNLPSSQQSRIVIKFLPRTPPSCLLTPALNTHSQNPAETKFCNKHDEIFQISKKLRQKHQTCNACGSAVTYAWSWRRFFDRSEVGRASYTYRVRPKSCRLKIVSHLNVSLTHFPTIMRGTKLVQTPCSQGQQFPNCPHNNYIMYVLIFKSEFKKKPRNCFINWVINRGEQLVYKIIEQ